MRELSQANINLVGTIGGILSIPSLIGAFFVIVVYLRFPDIRNFALKLVFFNAICDFSTSIFNLFMWSPDLETGKPLCTLQAWGQSFFYTSSIFWSMLIAFTIHMAFLREDARFTPSEVGSNIKFYYLVGWGIPLILSILPFTTNSYGLSGGWCWIPYGSPENSAWRVLQLYLWVWCAWGYSLYVYVRVIQKLKARSDDSIRVRQIMYYPLVLVLCWLFPSIHRIYETFTDGDEVLFLNLANTISATLFGFFNAIVYGLTPVVTDKLKTVFPFSYCVEGKDENVQTV